MRKNYDDFWIHSELNRVRPRNLWPIDEVEQPSSVYDLTKTDNSSTTYDDDNNSESDGISDITDDDFHHYQYHTRSISDTSDSDGESELENEKRCEERRMPSISDTSDSEESHRSICDSSDYKADNDYDSLFDASTVEMDVDDDNFYQVGTFGHKRKRNEYEMSV
jgi:hypothetical protein